MATCWVLPWLGELHQYQKKTLSLSLSLSGSDKGGAILVDGIVHLNDLVDWEGLADVQSTLLKEAYRLEAC